MGMMRWMCGAVLAWASLPTAAAEPSMWGVGPVVGTHLVPLERPAAFDDPLPASFDGTTWEVRSGVQGSVWLGKIHRLNTSLTADVGRRFFNVASVTTWNVTADLGRVEISPGGGLGVGFMQWTRGTGRLGVSHIPIRAEIRNLYKGRTWGIELVPFVTWRGPVSAVWRPATGPGATVSGADTWSVGLETVVLVGDLLRNVVGPRAMRPFNR